MKIMTFMFGKMNSKRKGITPVIAIVLLLMMTVAAAGMAYMWIMSLQEDMEETANEGIAKQRRDASSAITIESVWMDPAGLDIQFVIRNSGTYTFTATELGQFGYYIDGVPITVGTKCTGLAGAGSTCIVDSDELFPAAPGDEKVIMVKLPAGKGSTYTCRLKATGDKSC